MCYISSSKVLIYTPETGTGSYLRDSDNLVQDTQILQTLVLLIVTMNNSSLYRTVNNFALKLTGEIGRAKGRKHGFRMGLNDGFGWGFDDSFGMGLDDGFESSPMAKCGGVEYLEDHGVIF